MTTLSNTKLNDFDEKLMIYNTTFFSVISPAEGLLSETTSIKNTASSLRIPTGSEATYSIGQFATFIRKIVNFNIKDYSEATLTDTELCFVNKSGGSAITSNDNNRDHIIQTLKVINVFVDILEAYKYCIDNARGTFDSGYRNDIVIDRIEIVSDTTRFHSGATMTPSANNRNVGYIRTVSVGGVDTKVLYLSIQSYKTDMITATPANKYNYDELFTYSGAGTTTRTTNFLNLEALTDSTNVSTYADNIYKYQRFLSDDLNTIITPNGLTLDARNKSLIVLLIRTLFGLNNTFRKQSVYALYYYYKFVQLYSTFIIHVSNVMYNDVKSPLGTSASLFRIETYNMTTNKNTHGISAYEKRFKPSYTAGHAVSYQITGSARVSAEISTDTAAGGGVSAINVVTSGVYTSTPNIDFDEITGAVKPSATAIMGNAIQSINVNNQGVGYTALPEVIVTGGGPLKAGRFTPVRTGDKITSITINDGGVYTETPTITLNGGGATTTATTNNIVMTTTKRVGTITVNSSGSGYKTAPTVIFRDGGETTPATATATVAAGYAVTEPGFIKRGKGYQQNPTIILNPSTYETAHATIVPMVYAETTTTNNNNIGRLEEVIYEINETITELQDNLSMYVKSTTLIITTVPDDTDAEETTAYISTDNMVCINVKKPRIYESLLVFQDLYDLTSEYVIYDLISKKVYDIISVENTTTNDYKITINAVFIESDIDVKKQNKGTAIFTNSTQQTITPKPTNASPYTLSFAKEFLQLQKKDTNSYKSNYITTRDALSVLETDINFKSSKVTHQNNLYQSQNNKKIFLERQVLAYNIILAIIVIILVAINVVKVDKEVVKTVSLSCFGAIILLFVIYFISNLTYIETFATQPNDLLYDLTYSSYTADTTGYTNKKINKLKEEILKLNNRFIGYFEKLIITLPASENYDFYKEIYGIIENDKENKDFINTNLDYSKNQNDNNINSIKYELENNKLYINTLLISAVIFVGLYNLYINYITDDKYLSLLIFVCVIIFVIIVSYYYITANRRVKTVFKSIYWGPEFSKRF